MKRSKSPSRKKSIVLLFVLSVLIAVWTFFTFVPFEYGVKDYISVAGALTLGKDFGDSQFVQAKVKSQPEEGKHDEFMEKLNKSANVLLQRMNLKGFFDASVSVGSDGTDYYLRVDAPASASHGNALEFLASQGEITFRYDSSYRDGEVIIDSSHIENAVAIDPSYNNGTPAIAILLTEEGKDKIAAATTEIAGLTDESQKTMPIYIGEEEKYTPAVSSALTDGQLSMNVSTLNEAENIAILARTGALSVDLEAFEVLDISPALGFRAASVLSFSALAAIAVIIVLLVVFYGAAGIAAALSAVMFVLLYLLALIIVPGVRINVFTVSAILISVFVLITAMVGTRERILEEFRLGKKTAQAISSGHRRSILNVLDLHAPLFIAGLILIVIPIGAIAGFGVVLAAGMFVSALTVVVFYSMWLKILRGINGSEKCFKLTKEENTKSCPLTSIAADNKKFGKKTFITPAAIVGAALIMALVMQLALGSAFNKDFGLSSRYTQAQITVGSGEFNPADGNQVTFNNIYNDINKIISDYAAEHKISVCFSAPRYAGSGSTSGINFMYKFGAAVSQIDSSGHNDAIDALLHEKLPDILSQNGIEQEDQGNLSVVLALSSAKFNFVGWLVLATAILAFVPMLYFLLRFKLSAAIAVFAAVLHNALVLAAVALIVRLPLDMVHMSGLLFAAILSFVMLFVVFERIRANVNRLSLKDESVEFIVSKSLREAFPAVASLAIMFGAALLVLSIGGIFGAMLSSYALPLIIAVVLSVYTAFVFAPMLYVLLRKKIKPLKKKKADVEDTAKKQKTNTGGKSKKPARAASEPAQDYTEIDIDTDIIDTEVGG